MQPSLDHNEIKALLNNFRSYEFELLSVFQSLVADWSICNMSFSECTLVSIFAVVTAFGSFLIPMRQIFFRAFSGIVILQVTLKLAFNFICI